jgi:hypothetical protein
VAPVGREFGDDAEAAAHLTYEILWLQAAAGPRRRDAGDRAGRSPEPNLPLRSVSGMA